jgi:C4-dicarboxylate-specific signal transduction histidine kinase
MGVEVHIEQVLLNLIRNAIQAIRDSSTSDGSITISLRRLADVARVSVLDNGPGVDAAAAEGLFTLLASHKKSGLGVGLRISRSLIEAQGGRLWAEAHKPGGVFHFELPFAA